jgi:branched-chain amino acid transport system ATP-binding protein
MTISPAVSGDQTVQAPPEPVLSVESIAYDYKGVPAVLDCSISVPKGQIVALIGTNGAGKSTSVKMIAGALKPRAGWIRFDGEDITGLPAFRAVELGISLVPEGRLIFQHMSVYENLLVGGQSRRGRARTSESLDRVFELFPRLAERLRQTAGSLSGGEQQMLAIGRGLMSLPKLLILDEPSLGLGPKLVTAIFGLISKLNAEGISVLLVEQNVHQSLAISDRAFVLEKGRVVREGTGQALLKDPFVKEAYLGLA